MGRVGDFYLNKHALFLSLGCCDMGKHYVRTFKLCVCVFFFKFCFIFKLYIIVLALPNIKMNPSQ